VRLGDIAEVRFGIKTGANEFFYLDEERIAEWGIEEEFLKPVIKSPRECKRILVDPNDLKYKLFMCHEEKKALKGTAALEYIRWGESQGFHERPSCRGRRRWWDLRKREAASVNCNYLVDDRMRFYFVEDGVVSDNFQEIHRVDKLLAAIGSVPLTQLFCELAGRTPFGGGLLKIQTYEVEDLSVLAPSTLTSNQQARLLSAFDQMANHEIHSIFEELGLPRPNRDYSNIDPNDVSLDKILPDRRALDEVVFEVLGLTESEQLEAYRAVVALVKNRLMKARSC